MLAHRHAFLPLASRAAAGLLPLLSSRAATTTLGRRVGGRPATLRRSVSVVAARWRPSCRGASVLLAGAGATTPVLRRLLPTGLSGSSPHIVRRPFASAPPPADDDDDGGGGKKDSESPDPVDDIESAVRELEAEPGLVGPGQDPPRYPIVVVVPIKRRPLFPGVLYPLIIRDEALAKALVSLKQRGLPYVGVFLEKDSDEPKRGKEKDDDDDGHHKALPSSAAVPTIETTNVQDVSDVHSVGTFAHLWSITHMMDGTTRVLLLGHRRASISEVAAKEPLLTVRIEHHEEDKEAMKKEEATLKAYSLEVINTIKDILKRNPIFKEQLQYFLQNADTTNPSLLADYAAGLTTAESHELQEVLETFDVKERLSRALLLLKKELELSKLQEDISRQVEQKMSENQRRFMLQEQLRYIKRELGLEKDDKENLMNKFRERLEKLVVPEEITKVIEEEMEKLSSLESASAEFNVSRNYLDWLTNTPWGVFSQDRFDLTAAEEALDATHYGLKDVKERVLEFIAVASLLGETTHGKIICLVGPPGTGKTSIGKSIAEALQRKFYRFSVGGMTDVAEIKGHRRTYIGAMPGKFIQCLKHTGTSNPVILIDEIDKIGRGGVHGDPSSALLEALDPEQNKNFVDHFLDVPLDLSKVLFITTANTETTIPGPLADRMEFIRLPGYVAQEKREIAKRYLEPTARKETGVQDEQASIDEDAIDSLIRWYCREAGVRNLQKHVEKIYRKIAYRLVRDKLEEPVLVTTENLNDFVGKQKFVSDRLYDKTPVGVVMGLAWNSMGGAALYVESLGQPLPSSGCGGGGGGGSVHVTGQLGDVMKESSEIAMSVARAQLRQRQPHAADFFDKHVVHVHVPDGAVPKDGPSAGITMVTSLMSLALNRPVKPDVAMTGEVTLTGRVLPIGGVREKCIAAKRAGVHELIFPKENSKDFDELADYIREDIQPHFVEHYDQVFDIVFPPLAEAGGTAVEETAAM